jgi:peptide/nickel transport system permease protein
MAAVVDDLTFSIHHGETFGLVGESGCGKSMTALSIINLVPEPGRIANGSVIFGDRNLLELNQDDMRAVRGTEIALISQDPLAALSPVHTVGSQISETLRAHGGLTRRQAMERAAELLDLVGVPSPKRRLEEYPHQFSGGMAQRAVIAAALARSPRLLIADEPTTALDVTIQKQVMELLAGLQDKFRMSILLVTHDLGVVAEACDRVAVMYAGQIVEMGSVGQVLERPRHPYTAALIEAMPRNEKRQGRLATIPGAVPAVWDLPPGCRFQPRCKFSNANCTHNSIPLVEGLRCISAPDQRTREQH